MSAQTLPSTPSAALLAEVEAAHGPDATAFACRSCGWEYVGGVAACPPVLMARAGLPELAGRITYGGSAVDQLADQVTDQVGELSALIGQLREDVFAVHDTADEVLREVLPPWAHLPWPGWRRAVLAVARLVGGVGVAVLVMPRLWPALPPLSAARLGLLVLLLTSTVAYVQNALAGVKVTARAGWALLQVRRRGSVSLPPVGGVEPAAVPVATGGVR